MELDKLQSEWGAWDRDNAYFGDNGSHYGTVRSEASFFDPVPPPQMRVFPPKKEESGAALAPSGGHPAPVTALAPVSGGYPAREGVGAEQHMLPTGPASPWFGREEEESLNIP
jgi:hypothetical protein